MILMEKCGFSSSPLRCARRNDTIQCTLLGTQCLTEDKFSWEGTRLGGSSTSYNVGPTNSCFSQKMQLCNQTALSFSKSPYVKAHGSRHLFQKLQLNQTNLIPSFSFIVLGTFVPSWCRLHQFRSLLVLCITFYGRKQEGSGARGPMGGPPRFIYLGVLWREQCSLRKRKQMCLQFSLIHYGDMHGHRIHQFVLTC